MAKLIITSVPLKPGEYKGSPRPADYQALGEFISACSLLEVTMHLVLRYWLSIDERIARALIGEPRSGDLIELLRFAFEAQDKIKRTDEIKKTLDQLYEQAGFINKIRAVVAHKPCLTDSISLMFHNSLTARRESKLFRYVCTAKQLTNCAELTLNVAAALREVTTFGVKNQAFYIRRCDELIASFSKLDLPNRPQNSNQQTAKEKRQQQPSPE